MVDCGGKKIQVKKKRRRSDGGKTKDRRRTDEGGRREEGMEKAGEINKAALVLPYFMGIREICGNFYALLS